MILNAEIDPTISDEALRAHKARLWAELARVAGGVVWATDEWDMLEQVDSLTERIEEAVRISDARSAPAANTRGEA